MLEPWKILLDGDHTEAVWAEITRHAEGLPAERLEVLRDDLRGWAGKRPMPERWWRESRRGEHHPWHALCDHYVLWHPRIGPDDDDDVDPPEGEPDLEHGVATGAVSPDLRWLVLAAEPEGDRRGGDIGLWDTAAGSWRPMSASGHDDRLSAHDVRFSPDGSLVAIGMRAGGDRIRLAVWRTDDSELLWSAGPGEADDTDPWRFDPRDGSKVVVAFSGDGRRLVSVDIVAAEAGKGRVVVVESETGEVRFGAAARVHGSPVLDHTGERLAYLGQDGNLVVQAVASGEILVDHPIGGPTDEPADRPTGGLTGRLTCGLTGGPTDEHKREPTGRPTRSLTQWLAGGLAFSPDGGTLAIGGEGAVGLFRFETGELEHFESSGERADVLWPRQGLRVVHHEGDRVTVTSGVEGEVLWSSRPEDLHSFTPAGTELVTTRLGPGGGETTVWFPRDPGTQI
ncbi:WD40 repeat domain-containing protein [Nonomuraea sp. bgisy101]|uniref:WD40 repeat domain-containing protein n=1 Tax=Nonomuraea sp. bgisy101 TaxID=3413784 RepID=UPI003D70EFBF